MPEGDKFNAGEVQLDITRIRERLKRLDQERQAAVEQLRRAMQKADETIARRGDEPPAGAG